MKLAIGTDHRGFEHKNFLKKNLVIANQSIEWVDVGANTAERSDYPVYAHELCRLVREGKADLGILLCGSGVGMAIAANRFRGIYAALAWNEAVAKQSREDDNANVLVLPADFISPEQAVSMTAVWLQATFHGGRYQKRIEMLDLYGQE